MRCSWKGEWREKVFENVKLFYLIVVFSILFKNFEILYVVKIGLYINDIYFMDIWLKFWYLNDVCLVFEVFDDKFF